MNSMIAMTRRLGLLLAAVALVVSTLFVGASSAAAETITITMGAGGLKYNPAKITAHPGDTIEWKIGQLPPHNVVFDPAKSADKNLAKQLSHQKTEIKGSFLTEVPTDATPGSYSFYCTPHRGAGMVGTLTIE
ncbi:MAG: plastocyanin [Coleofasciculaceae cyanobacterium SM2_3_26]|nr:plastocyanin [Coleofasciculaceae cyanobacterium SM2_3_26]